MTPEFRVYGERKKVKVAQLCPTLWDPMDRIVPGIFQARILERVAYPFSSRSSWFRNRTRVSCIADGFFTNWAIYMVYIYTWYISWYIHGIFLYHVYRESYGLRQGNILRTRKCPENIQSYRQDLQKHRSPFLFGGMRMFSENTI